MAIAPVGKAEFRRARASRARCAAASRDDRAARCTALATGRDRAGTGAGSFARSARGITFAEVRASTSGWR